MLSTSALEDELTSVEDSSSMRKAKPPLFDQRRFIIVVWPVRVEVNLIGFSVVVCMGVFVGHVVHLRVVLCCSADLCNYFF